MAVATQDAAEREGYKRTSIGWIPADWQARSLGELEEDGLITLSRGDVISKIDIARNPGDYPIYSSSIHNNGEFGRYGKYMFDEELITWSIDGGGDFFHRPKHRFSVTNVSGLMRVDRRAFNYRFLASQLQLRHGHLTFDYTMKAHPSVIRSLYVVAYPRLEEQEAIADSLSEADALIASLDQLILKKRDLKTGTMQQLLTRKRRLPGFGGEWQLKCLGELGTFSKGKGIKKDDLLVAGIPCIRYGEIYTHHDDYIRSFHSFIPPQVARESQLLRRGDLLFAGSGETAEEIGKCVAFLGDEEAYAGGDIVIFTPVNQDSMYLSYLMNHASVAAQKARMGQGDAVVHISAKNLSQVCAQMPGLEEQTAIAGILSDIDADIAALEARRDKARAVKRGMMQQLLTGSIRLI